jgi:hypothetical protein
MMGIPVEGLELRVEGKAALVTDIEEDKRISCYRL